MEEMVANVVSLAHYDRLSIQGDFARKFATELSAAASLGLVSTETPDGFGRVWRATAKGILWLDGADL